MNVFDDLPAPPPASPRLAIIRAVAALRVCLQALDHAEQERIADAAELVALAERELVKLGDLDGL